MAKWNTYSSEALATCDRPALLYPALERMWRHNLLLNKYLIIFWCQMKSTYLRIGQVNAVWPGFIHLHRTESCLSLYLLSWSRNLSQSMEREDLLAYCVHENCTLSWTSWIQPSLIPFKFLRSFLMLLSSLCACLPNHLFISRFPNEILFTFVTAYYMQRPSLLKFMILNESVAVALLPSVVIYGVINSQLKCMTEYVL